MDTSYNPELFNYIKNKFKDMMSEDMLEEKYLIHLEHA